MHPMNSHKMFQVKYAVNKFLESAADNNIYKIDFKILNNCFQSLYLWLWVICTIEPYLNCNWKLKPTMDEWERETNNQNEKWVCSESGGEGVYIHLPQTLTRTHTKCKESNWFNIVSLKIHPPFSCLIINYQLLHSIDISANENIINLIDFDLANIPNCGKYEFYAKMNLSYIWKWCSIEWFCYWTFIRNQKSMPFDKSIKFPLKCPLFQIERLRFCVFWCLLSQLIDCLNSLQLIIAALMNHTWFMWWIENMA